jgi:hypothetical protein
MARKYTYLLQWKLYLQNCLMGFKSLWHCNDNMGIFGSCLQPTSPLYKPKEMKYIHFYLLFLKKLMWL